METDFGRDRPGSELNESSMRAQCELNESQCAIVYSARTRYYPCRHPFSDFGLTHPSTGAFILLTIAQVVISIYFLYHAYHFSAPMIAYMRASRRADSRHEYMLGRPL